MTPARAAALAVCGLATDTDDARHLLTALGLCRWSVPHGRSTRSS